MPATPAPAPRAEPDGPAGERAVLAALADRCVQCGLCLPHCPTYRLDRSEAESPRGRIAYVKAVAEGRLEPGALGDRHLDHCLGCRRCEAVCPAGVSYGDLLTGARAVQARRRRRPWRERLVLALMARPRWLVGLASLYRWLGPVWPRAWRPAGLPPPPGQRAGGRQPNPGFPAPAPGAVAGAPPAAPADDDRPALFVGCVAGPWEAPARAALVRLCAAAGMALDTPAGQGCCGTAARHAGDPAGADRLDIANRRAFAGRTRVLCLASGCQDALARSLGPDTRVEDAVAALEARADRLRFRNAGARRVALHVPCSQRNVLRTDGSLRRLLARVPGLDLVELPDTGCCGAAGLHQLSEPTRAAALRQALLESLAGSGAGELLSANIGCRLHLAGGTTIPVRHPVEFLAEHLA
ncbi:(Fe-S)-binding protein [Arenimonas fontis]|uniref:Glycolate oxidase iron-sulfur subunit n=1 Tax=Arenimonas fontis TaxID=2608255 RepID=A0A5B2ZBT5_9GAMM|nr:(Fe-S)-binding protein [Arenimonas fontis]KAA2285003.1 (Fe-S)-binding protein [Arenimonas fontis]